MAQAAGEATTQLLAEVQALYDRALYRQAWQRGRPLGELKAWPGIEGRILAGRLAWCFGDSRLGDALFNLAWRSNRSNPKALYYRSLVILHRRGPLHSWRFLRARGELEGACVELRADWLAQHAAALAQLRDFGRAAEYLDRAEALAPDRPWVWVERAAVLDEEDRREEALEAAERALRLRHGYRPAIQRAAHLLHQLGRSDTALELLQEASCQLEAPGVTRQLVSSLMERERYADARLAVKRLVDITPLRGKRFVENVNGLCSDIAYHLGDLDAARRYAAKAGEGFFSAIVERLGEAPAESRIVRLPVKFVRQNFVTCAPATLSAQEGE